MRIFYNLEIINAYSSDFSSNYDKVMVFEIEKCMTSSGSAKEMCPICASMLRNNSSDWNLFFEFNKIDIDGLNAIFNSDVTKSMMGESLFCVFVASDKTTVQMINEVQRGSSFERSVLFLGSTAISENALNLDSEGISNLPRVFFADEMDFTDKAHVIDAISYAYLNQSLVCVDVYDLFAVLGESLSGAILFKSSYAECFNEFLGFLNEYQILLERSPGVFVCLMYGGKDRCTIDHIDKYASLLLATVPRDAMLFLSVDNKRELDFEFGCALLVNVL